MLPESEAASQARVCEPPVLAVKEILTVFVTLDEDEAGVVSVSQSELPQPSPLPPPSYHFGSVCPNQQVAFRGQLL